MRSLLGKILIIVGIFIIILGLLITFGQRIPLLGKLPGDFTFRRGNIMVYLPLVTSIVISVILTVVVNLVFRFWRK